MLWTVLAPLVVGIPLTLVSPRRTAPAVALLALGSSLASAVYFVHRLLGGGGPSAFGGLLRLDAPGAIVLLLVLTLGFLAALVSSQTETRQRRFYALLLAFIASMTLAAVSDNLGILWASIEATTLASAPLVGHRRNQQATEAAWKYLILASTGITIAFAGTIVLASAARGAGAATLSWSLLLAQAPAMDAGLVRLAGVLAVVGYGTKAGLVPFHFWLPDAHSQAPSPVSGLLSGVLLACSLLALDRFLRIGRAAGGSTDAIVLVLGAVTVLAGGLMVLGARNYKRMLAHHSAENMGLVAFALALGTPLALAGAYFHIVAHGVAKSMAFFAAGRIHHHYGSQLISEVKGALARAPAAGRGLLMGVLALIGVPLMAPFTSKVIILSAAVSTGPWPLTAMVVVGLALAFVGGMHHASELMGAPTGESAGPPLPPAREPWTVVGAFALLAAANVLLGLAGPHLLHDLLAGAAALTGGAP